MPTSIGQLLVNEILPPKYQDTSRTLGANELEDLLAKIAKEDPSIYKDVSARLMRLGNRGAYESGTTLRLSDILPTFDKSVVLKGLNRQEDAIRANKRLTDEQKSALINDLYDKANDLIKQQTYETAVAIRNPFAMQVKSKARGNQDQLAAMISTPGIYTDPRGRIVPMFIQHSFAEGLTPAEYWAGSFGARLGVVSTKMSTAKGGYLGKLFSMASMDEVVTEPDCGGAYGMPVKADDKDNIGCVLQQDIGGHEAGEVITKDTLSDFARKNIDEIIVRSPVTCACKNGVCSKCCGIRETGGFPPIGYNLGLNAASAISERITQGALNCLVEGTLVRMADGSVKPIEKVDPGELVFGSDLHGHVRPTRVVARYDNGTQPCVRTKILPGNGIWLERLSGHEFDENRYIVLESTAIHKVLTTSSKMEEIGKLALAAEKEKAGGKICYSMVSVVSFWHSDAPEGKRPLSIFGVEETDGTSVTAHPVWSQEDIGMRHVYDLEVECKDHIYLLANGLVVHNTKHCLSPETEVLLGDKSHKKLRDITPGDTVMGYGKDGSVQPVKVLNVWNNGTRSVYRTTFKLLAQESDDEIKIDPSVLSIDSTLDHKVWGVFGITTSADSCELTPIGDKPGEVFQVPIERDSFVKLHGSVRKSVKPNITYCLTRDTHEYLGELDTMDIEVDHPDHMFVLANGLIVSNSGKKAKGKSQFSGFEAIKNMATVPGTYPDAAVVATEDGTITKIEKAPQGGSYVYVNDTKLYVAPNYDIEVKEGDEVEAGDQISDGVINPVDVVNYKGIGEGRRYFTNRFTQMMKDSNYKVNRRNVEALARSLVNHVRVEAEDAEGQLLPGDVSTYSQWSFGYKPRTNSVMQAPKKAIGQYLEQPVLHYTIGTKISKKTAADMAKYGIDQIYTNPNPVDVTPMMQSIVKSTGSSNDWMARLGTTYLKTRLTEDAQRGAESNLHGTNPLPGVAKGVEFGNYFDPGIHRPGGYTY